MGEFLGGLGLVDGVRYTGIFRKMRRKQESQEDDKTWDSNTRISVI